MAHREPKSGSIKRGHILITKLRRGQASDGYSIEMPEEKTDDIIIKEPSDVSVESVANENSGNCSFSTRRRLNSESVPGGTGTAYFPSRLPQTHPQQQQRPTTQSEFIKEGNGGDGEAEGTWNVLDELLTSIQHLISKQEEVEAQNNLVAEWRLVAQVVDRILFWLFFIFTFSSSAMILLVLPIYKRSWYGSPLRVINDTDIIEPRM